MNIYRLVVVLMIGLFLTSCARMAGYKSDYNVLGSVDIKKMMVGKTIDYRLSGKHFITYYSNNGKYFTLYLSNNTSGFKEMNIYDIGTWYVTDSTIHISKKSYKVGKVCKRTNLSSNTISQLSTGCNEVMMNGGNWYLNNLTTEPFRIHNGSSLILKNILNIQHRNVKALNAYESMFGVNSSVFAKKEKVLREIRIKKQREKIEKEKRERARREREARRAQQRTSRSTSSYSGGGGSISLCVPSIPSSQNTSECSAKTASGRYATVKLRNDLIKNCFTLSVYGGDGFGNGSTCSGPNDYWAVNAKGSSGGANGLANAVAWILGRL